MVQVVLHSIFHQGTNWIGLFAPMDLLIDAKLLQQGARFTKTYNCWLLPREQKSIAILKNIYPEGTNFNDIPLRECLLKEKAATPAMPAVLKPAPTSAKAMLTRPLCTENMEALPAIQDMIILKGYSSNTLKTYTSEFHVLLRVLSTRPVDQLTPDQIKSYLLWLITTKKYGEAQVNTAVNAIKFYFEKVLNRPQMVIELPRPKKRLMLPKVLGETEVQTVLRVTDNIKHKAMLMIGYGCGLRVSEIVDLTINNIDKSRMMILIERAKGKKDRMVPLPQSLLPLLREYYKQYRPKKYLFEGQDGG
jgi:integrase/recombinase XerD